MEFIDLKSQYQTLQPRIDAAIHRVLNHGQYILGPEVQELEEKLAWYVGVRHCISVANGTDALQISLMALGIGRGDEVIMPSFNYIATAEATALLGAKPVFVDVDPRTYNVDPALLERSITSRTKAIVPVNLYGQCADFDKINKIAAKFKIPVIEDAAQSFGATYKGSKSGSLSTIACTSFFPSKPLGCYGDGGAILTNDDELAVLMRQIARHGQDRRYHHVRVGINSRLDTIQAAVLLVKLDVLDTEIAARDLIAQNYAKLLQQYVPQAGIPSIEPFNVCAWAQYTVRTPKREMACQILREANIPTAIHYPLPLHKQPAVEQGSIGLKFSEKAAEEVLSLPMHASLGHADQLKIVQTLAHTYN